MTQRASPKAASTMHDDLVESFFTSHSSWPKGRKFPRHAKRLNRCDDEGMPVLVRGMTRVHRLCGEYRDPNGLCAHAAPLRRFLDARVGKPWDAAYAEIRSRLDARSRKRCTFDGWLWLLVDTECTIGADGSLLNRWGSPVGAQRSVLYVHPRTRILERAPDPRRARSESGGRRNAAILEAAGRHYRRHEGLWYRVEMREWDGNWATLPAETPRDAFGVFLGGTWGRPSSLRSDLAAKYGLSPQGNLWYCVSKRSAGRKEIARVKACRVTGTSPASGSRSL
ncbi:MAG: hypothetical protein JXR77_18900 [Lentisphaeria bacterium]|nr:hypothetical protein [Lentisphaeria bacterium]